MPAVCPDLAWGERRGQDRRRDRTMDLSCIELGTEGFFGREAWGSRDRMMRVLMEAGSVSWSWQRGLE